MLRFDLLELHDGEVDRSVRQLLRIYNVLARYSPHPPGKQDEQAVKVTQFLTMINKKLQKKYNCWTKVWLKEVGYGLTYSTCKDWLVGRSSPPLIAMKKLKIFGYEKQVERLISNSSYFSSTTNRPFTMPHKLSPELAYLIGAILGDGHIPKVADKVSFEVSEEWLAKKFIRKVAIVFKHYLPMSYRMDRGKLRYVANFANKSATRFFAKIIGIPRGKKSHIIVVPEIIKKSNRQIRIAFLEGVFDTDGGKRGKGYLGLTSASEQFRDDVAELIECLNIKVFKDKWLNKLYKRTYYGLRFSKKNKVPFYAGVR